MNEISENEMHLTLIRHGMTRGNERRRYVGRTDEELSDGGRGRIAENVRNGIYPPADIVIASPMRRCMETAKLIYPGQTPIVIDAFRETDFGDFEYRSYRELKGDPVYQKFLDTEGVSGIPGGESKETFLRRCASGMETVCGSLLAELLPEASVSMIVHGGTIMALFSSFGIPQKSYYAYWCENGGGFSCRLRMTDREISLTEAIPLPEISPSTAEEMKAQENASHRMQK